MNGRFDPRALIAAVDAQRQARRMSWGDLSKAVGVDAQTIRDMPFKQGLETDGILQLTRWLGLNIENFVSDNRDAGPLPEPGDVASSGRRLRFDTRALYDALDARRREKGLTWQQASEEICKTRVTARLLIELAQSRRIEVNAMLAIVEWLGERSSRYTRLAAI